MHKIQEICQFFLDGLLTRNEFQLKIAEVLFILNDNETTTFATAICTYMEETYGQS